MIYVKAAIVGIICGLLAAILWVVGNLFLPVYAAWLIARVRGDGAGAGGAMVGSGSTLLAMAFGFAAGAWWTMRRGSRRKSQVAN